jgi:hypothetical protein
MLLYKITYQIKHKASDSLIVNTYSVWVGSQAEAATKRRNIRHITGYMPNSVQTSKIDVPTKKADLIKFLNSEII